MNQTLVLSKRYYESLKHEDNIAILLSNGYSNADSFIEGIIQKLNAEYSFFDIKNFRFFTTEEQRLYSMYGSFVDNFKTKEFDSNLLCFTPVQSKLGNTIVSQELMPVIAKLLTNDINFLFNTKIKKIFILSSQINKDNIVKDDEANTLQLNVNALNSMGFDVIQHRRIRGLSTGASFSSLDEYLSLLDDLRRRQPANDQTEYIYEKEGVVYGQCEKTQIKGQFQKFFAFRFLTAVMLGKNEYTYDISNVLKHKVGGNQFEILSNFIDYVNNNMVANPLALEENIEDTSPISSDELNNTSRTPEMLANSLGSKRFKTKRNIREESLKQKNYHCDCHDEKHFYFESSVNLENYVEGHHIIPMNRQESYWNDYGVNLDVLSNVIPLCPNCHTQIHNGSRGSKLMILSEIYIRHEKNLKSIDKDLTFAKLANYYNILISSEEEKYYLKYGEKAVRVKNTII